MRSENHSRPSSAGRDLVMIAILTVIVAAVAVTFDGSELVVERLRSLPDIELDELLIVAPLLLIATTVFSVRRWRELERQLAERARSDTERREADLRFETLVDSMDEGLLVVDTQERIQYANPRFCEMSGLPLDALAGQVASDRLLDQEGRAIVESQHEFRRQGMSSRYRLRYRTPTGEERWFFVSGAPLRNNDGAIVGSIGIHTDITDQMRIEEELQSLNASLERLVDERTAGLEAANQRLAEELAQRTAVEIAFRDVDQFNKEIIANAGDGITVYDHDLRYLGWNPRMEELTGLTADEVLGKRATDLFPHLTERGVVALLERALAGELVRSSDVPYRVPSTGRSGWVRGTYGPLRNGEGAIIGAIGIVSDITDRKQVEDTVVQFNRILEHRVRERTEELAQTAEALQESEARYRELVENARDVIFACDLDGCVTSMNQRGRELFGVGENADRPFSMLDVVVPDDHWVIRESLRQGDQADRVSVHEMDVVTRDNRRLRMEFSCWPQVQGDSVVGVQGVARDVTERRSLEERLRQAQKLEAVGQLAGGIAHDFNNLLTAINGFSELLIEGLSGKQSLRNYASEIKKAGNQAAALTSQLLAYGRRQMLSPSLLDLNEIVESMQHMMRRLISEDIQLDVALDQVLNLTYADSAQLQQVLLNLVVNARDAMPDGGTIAITTRNLRHAGGALDDLGDVPAGDYVALSVRDTGVGMDADTRAHMFEPFFTTKEQGKGTGLGLSTVYGIVSQSDGHLLVKSAPGQGTTFTVLLPRLLLESKVTAGSES